MWPQHRKAVEVFAALETQWRIVAGVGFVRYEGIDYGAVTKEFLNMMGVSKRQAAKVFKAVRIMERSACEVLNQKAKEASDAAV